MTFSIKYTYIAAKPIRAEHPVGSGIIVDYQPGDVIPAEDWGRAADNLCEVGKAFRTAINLADPVVEAPVVKVAAVVSAAVDAVGVVGGQEYPRHIGAGVWEVSDGSRVKGKAAAIESELALGGE